MANAPEGHESCPSYPPHTNTTWTCMILRLVNVNLTGTNNSGSTIFIAASSANDTVCLDGPGNFAIADGTEALVEEHLTVGMERFNFCNFSEFIMHLGYQLTDECERKLIVRRKATKESPKSIGLACSRACNNEFSWLK